MNGALNLCMPRHRARAAIVALLALVLAAAVGFFTISPASASERVALVIGNSAYDFAPELKNPRNDAKALAASLNRLGFRVIKGIDADRFTMRTLVRAFSTEMKGAKIALFYYAGHGLQLNGKNYLIPVDARLQNEADLDFEAMDVNFVLRQMERDERVNIVLLDACRNNPLSDKLARSMGTRSVYLGRGLARIETGIGSLVAFSTQPGNVALDGLGTHSPFAKALIDNIETPGLDVDVLMRRVREEVIKITDGRQVPWSSSSLVGDKVVLRSLDETPAPADQTAKPTSPGSLARTPSATLRDNILNPLKPRDSDKLVGVEIPAPREPAAPGADQVEITFWKTVRESRDPALIRTYLQKYPHGHFGLIAQAMLAELEAGQKPTGTPALSPSGIPLPREKPQVNLQPREVPPAESLQPAPRPQRKAVKPPPAEKKTQRKHKVTTPPPRRAERQKSCGFCYDCMTQDCRQRRWTCGARYLAAKQQGLCQYNR